MTVKRLYEKVAVLKHYPKLGRVIPEMQEDQYRELIEGNYRVMYEILNEEIILIQRVLHSSRFFDKL